MWWVGEERLEVVAARTLTPDEIQTLQAWLLHRAVGARRRAQFEHRCIDCGTKREPKSHGTYLRCGSCAASWRMKVKKQRVSAWLVDER